MEQAELRKSRYIELELDNLKAPSWTLRPLNNDVVTELERSIETMGLLQPIVVRKCAHEYEIVFGNHRVEACRRLGMKYVRAIIRDFSEDDAFLARVSENLVRNNYIDPIEEAEGYKMLVNRGWSMHSIGRKVGKSDSYVSERLAVLEHLRFETSLKVRIGQLTASHAELLSRIHDPVKQNQLAELVIKRRLSVRSLENLLNESPPPTVVMVQNLATETSVRIPREYLDALGLDGESPHEMKLYVRGRKLVLEHKIRKGNRKGSYGCTSHVRTRSPTS